MRIHRVREYFVKNNFKPDLSGEEEEMKEISGIGVGYAREEGLKGSTEVCVALAFTSPYADEAMRWAERMLRLPIVGRCRLWEVGKEEKSSEVWNASRKMWLVEVRKEGVRCEGEVNTEGFCTTCWRKN